MYRIIISKYEENPNFKKWDPGLANYDTSTCKIGEKSICMRFLSL